MLVAGAILAGVIAYVIWVSVGIRTSLPIIRDWVLAFGPTGAIFFIAIYALAVVAFVPATPFTLVAVAIYGPWGVPVALVGALIGACASFGITRSKLRDRVEFLCRRRRITLAIDRAVARAGWWTVFLVRLSPILPFSLQNYAFGLTAVGFQPYLWATLVGMVPGTLLKIWVAQLGFAAAREVTFAGLLALAIGIVAAAIVAILVARLARRELADIDAGLEAR